MEQINYWLILSAALVATSSPGPATLAISSVSMKQGRSFGLSLAAGILTGSLFWSISAAFGLGAVMFANAWLFELVRYMGAAYLLYLSVQSAASLFSVRISGQSKHHFGSTYRSAYMKGLLIHLTNPKAILFFGALYSIGIPTGSSPDNLLKVIILVGCSSATIFIGYALLFSLPKVQTGYQRMRPILEGFFSLFFAIAGLRLLVRKLI